MDWLLFYSDSHEAAWITQPGVLGGAVPEDSSQLGLTPGGKTNYKGLRGWGSGFPSFLLCCGQGLLWVIAALLDAQWRSWGFEKGGGGKRYLNWCKSVITGSLGLFKNACLKNWVKSVFSDLCWSPAWMKPVLYYFEGYSVKYSTERSPYPSVKWEHNIYWSCKVFFPEIIFLLCLAVSILRLGSCLVWLLGAKQRWC